MRLRIGTFNVENLLTRHRFEAGGRTETQAAMSLFHFPRAVGAMGSSARLRWRWRTTSAR